MLKSRNTEMNPQSLSGTTPRGRKSPPLLNDARKLARGLYSSEIVKKKLGEATAFSKGHGLETKWETRNWLFDTHRYAREQVRLLNKCVRRIERIKKTELQDDHLQELLCHCAVALGKRKDLQELSNAAEVTKQLWLDTQERIRQVRPPRSFALVFLRLTSTSGVEAASLLVGGLTVLGIVYMSFLYEAAIGISAFFYWTLEDLFINGILMFGYVVGTMIILEFLFYICRFLLGRKPRYIFLGLVLRSPVCSVLCFLLLMIVVVSGVGYCVGISTFEKFTRMNSRNAQMATVLNNTVLEPVYLVGTSLRTAFFLRPIFEPTANTNGKDESRRNGRGVDEISNEEWKNWSEKAQKWSEKAQQGVKGFRSTARNVFRPFENKQSVQTDGANTTSAAGNKPYEVLILDRAMVVCHSRLGKCERPGDNEETAQSGTERK